MPVRAVVFDLFDTLVDLHMENLPHGEFRGRPIPGTTEALYAALAARCEMDFDRFAETLITSDRALMKSHLGEGRELPTELRFQALVEALGLGDPELPGILTSVHMGRLREQVAVPDHHAHVLARLARRVRIGLCSNFSHAETAVGVLEEAGLADPFDALVISETHGLRKPRPEIFESALEALGVAPDEALHVGDNLKADVAGAAAVGIRTVWITRRVADPEQRLRDHEGPAPDHTIEDLAEISALLDA